jgi:hypothetical protein
MTMRMVSAICWYFYKPFQQIDETATRWQENQSKPDCLQYTTTERVA